MTDVPGPIFSVVIPALNEEAGIESTIDSARAAYGDECQILVVDGGSIDRTRDVARGLCRVIVRTGGRGAQMNAGAGEARGDVLVFLHADTHVDGDSGSQILRALEDPDVVGGCHRFRVEPAASRLSRYALLEAGVNLRTRVFRAATGDQVIFVRRKRFHEADGYPEHPLFEDVALVKKLRRIGRFQPLRSRAHTSRRRWERHGFARTVVLHWLLRAAFVAGVKPARLADWYV